MKLDDIKKYATKGVGYAAIGAVILGGAALNEVKNYVVNDMGVEKSSSVIEYKALEDIASGHIYNGGAGKCHGKCVVNDDSKSSEDYAHIPKCNNRCLCPSIPVDWA